jgi:hypothetical protein
MHHSNPDQRRALITRKARSSKRTAFIPYRNSFSARPVINLPIDLPVLRADNGRLAVLKTVYINEHKLASDYFKAGQDTDEIQALLQSFLITLSQVEHGPIFQELERTAIQTEPFLATADGVVLNGNRRLAAMRALLAEDPDRYANFGQLDVAVLPSDASIDDLEMTEAALQMAPETKLAYGWIDRRLKLRRHREMPGLSDEDICKSYRLASAKQIDEELEEFCDVERYLADFAHHPLDYPLVADQEAYFVGMRQNLAGRDDNERETWKLAGFAMIHQAENLKIEAERYFPFSGPKPAYAPSVCLMRFGNEEALWPPRDAEERIPEFSREDYAELRRVLGDPSRAEATANAIMKHFDRLLSEYREQQLTSARHLIQSTQHLNRQLAKLGPGNFTEAQRRELGGLLAETQYHARLIGGERQTSVETALSHIAGWIFFIRRKALLISKRRKNY